MNEIAENSTSTACNEADVPPVTPTIIPTEELIRLLPSITSVWIPAQFGERTEAENRAMKQFIRFLPVSSKLDSTGLLYLTRLVAPFYEGRDGAVVLPQQIVEAWDRHFVKYQRTTSVPMVLASLSVIFGAEKVLVIGQIEIEHDATTGQLTLRRNVENYNRLLEFLVLLDGEMLA
ncbi:MAG: hypothetical protein WCS99_09410 [Limisphaerales bacterium]